MINAGCERITPGPIKTPVESSDSVASDSTTVVGRSFVGSRVDSEDSPSMVQWTSSPVLGISVRVLLLGLQVH